MAELINIPAGSLRELAGDIPDGTLAAMPRWEALARVIYAKSLYDRAETEPLEDSGKTRVLAGRVLRSMPLETYLDELKRLGDQMGAASGAEDHDECGRIFGRLHELQTLNPEIPAPVWQAAGFGATAAELADMNKLASRALGVSR